MDLLTQVAAPRRAPDFFQEPVQVFLVKLLRRGVILADSECLCDAERKNSQIPLQRIEEDAQQIIFVQIAQNGIIRMKISNEKAPSVLHEAEQGRGLRIVSVKSRLLFVAMKLQQIMTN